ncbi:methyl-accepting chemotaxis protein [Marinomonas sp. IMCC 4694]|uniref:methyl-accepting chemotaxis protein n=1 Tax=Marinomonas sp. IMCC 4694 TaxID=2605432 RepID=UPI0011E61609|nr:methyl-accepting chemotaxis protein [Marinomonas sp. IMCC 4694]TYL47004.1 methyl-accepting chemotaxis protein [Marinomonas sp. IMCC 4694]
MFSNLKVSQSIAIIGVLPSLFAIILVAFLVTDLNKRVEEGLLAEDMVKLSTVFDGVAHNFAVERGLSAGFLGSKGANGGDALMAQRKVADKAESTLRNLSADAFDVLTTEQLDGLRTPVLLQLKGKAQTRQKVEALAVNNGAFDFYSEVNRRSLNAIQQVILDIRNRDIAKALEARLSLLWMKERAGQYRGALNGVYAAQATTLKRQSQIAVFIEDEQHQLEYFNSIAPDNEVQMLRQIEQNEKWKAVDKATQAFLAMSDVSSVQGPDGWFALATAKIGLIKGVADKASEGVNTLSADLASHSELYRNGLIIVFVLLITPIILLAFRLSRSLTKRVEDISQALSNVSSNRNLVGRIENTSNDELGEIIQYLNVHLDHLRSSFGLMVEMATESKESMNVLSGFSRSALKETKDQFNQTDLMAAAVEEMSLTSNTISQDMQSSAQATDSIREQSTKGSERMQTILQSIAHLSSEVEGGYKAVQSVTGHTEEISSILQTIESIAEQTNLLALNAAIEAARAGEQGRGFAVVADEVRTLAKRTQSSTEEIRSMISALVSSGKSALASMDQCASMATDTSNVVSDNVSMMQGLFDAIEALAQTIERVATSSEEQSQVSEEINKNIQNVSHRSQTILDLVNKTDDGAGQAKQRFDDVLKEISSYKLR